MSRRLLLIPTGVGSGGGGGFDPTQYYTKSQIDALIADFVTASTNSLINYYLKSETYTQAEVNSLISAIETTHFEVYASLSDITNPQSNVLYLVGPIGNGGDKYEIYIYSNNQFVKIDDTSIDLSGYATTTDLQNAINTAMATLQQYAVDNFYQKSEVDAMIAQVQTLQGIQGIAGQNGTNGVDGLQGIQGIMGIQGASGSGGGASRYDISTKSQAELADFYQNWETIMASNDVYVGVYPVTSVIPEYTVQGYTALLVEYNVSFALEADATTQTPVVKGDVGAYYILPNGMGGTYGTDVTMPSKNYVDAVVSGIQAIQGIQGTAGTNGANGLQGIQGIQGASGGGASKIELTTLPMQDLLQFYQATLAGTMKDFSQYTAGGYPLINAYQMNAGWVVDTSWYTGTEGTTYTTDGTEVAIVMNQKVEAVGTKGNETQRYLCTFITLFSPTIYQTYGQTIDMDIKIGYDQVAQLQFVLADNSVVNYTMPLTQW